MYTYSPGFWERSAPGGLCWVARVLIFAGVKVYSESGWDALMIIGGVTCCCAVQLLWLRCVEKQYLLTFGLFNFGLMMPY